MYKQERMSAVCNSSGRWLSIGLLLVMMLLDQITKLYVNAAFQYGEILPVVPGFFNLTLRYNTGAAFSFLAEAGGWQKYFFTALALVVSIWLGGGILLEKFSRLMSIAAALISSGAIGNIIDRWVHGHVIDFLQFYYQSWYYPAFNLADSCICIGAVLMIWDSFRRSGNQQ